MKKILGLLIIALVLVLIGIRLYDELAIKASSSPEDQDFLQRPTMLVETSTAQRREFRTQLDILGELEPRASVDVMSKVGGRLKEVLVERGDRVRRGQLLAVVDDEDLLQQIRRAEAAIAVARAAVNREQASCENLQVQAKRYRGLHEASLVSTQELEDLESRVRVAEAQVELAKAQVEQAEASLRELKLQQEQTRVYSPLDGYIGTQHLFAGALVNPSLPIVTAIEVSRVKTVVPVVEGMLAEMRVGLPALITVDAFPGVEHRGRVTRISPFLDPETRSADIEIEIDNSGGQLKPGMFARVAIEAREPEEVLAIPRSALLTLGDQKGVFLLNDEQMTRFQEIQIGRIQGTWVEVLDGLSEGTRVVTSGAQKLNEGDKVRLE